MQIEQFKRLFSWSVTSMTVGDAIDLLSPSEKGMKFYTAQSFGFMKTAVSLTSTVSTTNYEYLSLETLLSQVKVVGVDLFLGKISWTYQLGHQLIVDEIRSKGFEHQSFQFKISSAKIVVDDESKLSVYLSLEAKSKSLAAYAVLARWTVDSGACEFLSSAQGQCHRLKDPEEVRVEKILVSQMSTSAQKDQLVYIGESLEDGGLKVVTAAAPGSHLDDHYFYRLDKLKGEFLTFKMSNSSCSTSLSGGELCEPSLVGSFVFPANEQVVSEMRGHVPSSIPGVSRAEVLGDDSVLMKYTNPNSVVVVSKIDVDGECFAVITIVDGVSAKVIHRVVVEDAVEPVHTATIENNVVVTYWNVKSKRTELLSMMLYEGMINKHGLGPMAKQEQPDVPFSSFNFIPPIVIQKTYILPLAVRKLHYTITKNSISIVNLLVAFQNGQIYSLDRRQINPRRPASAPSKDETAEGLAQYNPYIMMNQLKYLTLDSTVASTRDIVSSSTKLESTSLVFAYGLDCYFSRDMPSNAFDQLAPDFNGLGLIAILVFLFFAVQVLRKMAKRKVLMDAWK